jgi:predicted nucleic acid-binding protein
MIVVDTSVWVDYLRDIPSPEAILLDDLFDRERLIVGDLILCEVLSGVPGDAVARRTESLLREFRVERMVDDALAVEAARHFRALRRQGITIRKTMDLLIGSWCIRHRHRLLHRDRDFDAMERHLGLDVLHA